MAASTATSSATCNIHGNLSHTSTYLSSKPHYHSISGRPCNSPSKSRPLTIVSMAPPKEGEQARRRLAEEVKVLSKVEKAGLLTKAEELGLTLTSIEKLGLLSKAEELGLLSLLEKAAGFSPSALASAALPILVAAVAAIVLIPDDSGALVAVQAVVAGTLGAGAAGLLVGSVVLDGLQEAD
ncbi:hypothetical protein L3X38_029361 [Prunus dulcis]|uniref:Uncharacterized protein n=1 Tax=Prunus dulcis TaxID=3755 RepID=A0AAD4Z2B7_PRUDU|nr:hypothetical protein L3X38_029361 [Prunus dulcis]